MSKVCMGSFHGVVAVGYAPGLISIVNNQGFEFLIQVTGDVQAVSGEFGSFDDVKNGVALPGLKIRKVVGIHVDQDSYWDEPELDYHVRTLRIVTTDGEVYWHLFVEGSVYAPVAA